MAAAATLAVSSLMQPFGNLLERQIEEWRHGIRVARCAPSPNPKSYELVNQFILSSTVLRTHRDKTYPGAMRQLQRSLG